jgi:hypothetical protein
MKKVVALFVFLFSFSSWAHAEEAKVDSGHDDVVIPESYKEFRLIGVSQRSDDHSLRAIVGNEAAIEAVRTGKTNPWPNGTLLVKLGWKHKQSDKFPAATIPDEFTSTAFMIKDDRKYAATGGWGWGERIGLEQKPYDKPGFAQECIACHSAVKDQDLVFTRPVKLP